LSLNRRLSIAETNMARASDTARLAFDNAALVVTSKGPGDVVSETDFAIERMVREAIAAQFPEDGFIGEELGGALHEQTSRKDHHGI